MRVLIVAGITMLMMCKAIPAATTEPNADELTAAFSAKVLGSALFISGREVDDALEQSVYVLARMTGYRSEDFSHIRVDWEQKSVTVTVKKKYTRTARLFGDQGVIILPAGRDDVFFNPVVLESNLPDPASQPWPMGDQLPEDAWAIGSGKADLEAGLDVLFKPENHTAAFVMLHRGRIIAERYAAGAHRDMPLESWSMGKSLTAILYGRSAHLDESWNPLRIAPIAQWQIDGDVRSTIRIADLFRMSSGLRFSAAGDPPDSWGQAHPDHIYVYSGGIDVYDFSLRRPIEYAPNTLARYRNCDPLIIGYLLKQAVAARKGNYLTFPRRELFEKLGIRHMILETDAWGNFILTGFDYGSARDWARLGLLMLQDGVWRGERLLPEGFVDFVSTPAPAWDPPAYGGLFWVNKPGRMNLPESSYYMAGQGGQYVFIVPSHDLVIVRLGHQAGSKALDRNLNQALGFLVDAVAAIGSDSGEVRVLE